MLCISKAFLSVLAVCLLMAWLWSFISMASFYWLQCTVVLMECFAMHTSGLMHVIQSVKARLNFSSMHVMSSCIMGENLCPLKMPCWWQISGHVTDEEGKKRIALVGKWNSYLDMQKCDVEGTPLPGAQLVRLWTVHNASCCKCPHAMPLLLGAWQSDSKCTVHKQKGTAEE
jgi:hypothetical protein